MHKLNYRRCALRAALLASAAFAGAAGLASAALAQEAGASTAGEIVVTAQKGAQNLQDVPIAVTAVS